MPASDITRPLPEIFLWTIRAIIVTIVQHWQWRVQQGHNPHCEPGHDRHDNGLHHYRIIG